MDIPDGVQWRLSEVNDEYSLSPSLPKVLVVPEDVRDEQLRVDVLLRASDGMQRVRTCT